MVVKKNRVIVVAKKDQDKYLKQGWALAEEQEDTVNEASKYLKYSDLLLKKARLVAQGPVASKEVAAVNKEIAKEMKKLGITEEANLDEWISKSGTRRRVKERDQRKYNKLKEWEDAVEASGDKEAYQKFFDKVLKKFGVSSPAELEGEKKKEFFNYIDKNWKADHEEVDVHKSYRVDGRRTNFREKMKKLGYIKSSY
jgi:NADH dehydrogenase/NADH:ubiquinone oxidoreductase subunit G